MPTIPAALALPGSASPVIILQYFHYKKIAMKNLERLATLQSTTVSRGLDAKLILCKENGSKRLFAKAVPWDSIENFVS